MVSHGPFPPALRFPSSYAHTTPRLRRRASRRFPRSSLSSPTPQDSAPGSLIRRFCSAVSAPSCLCEQPGGRVRETETLGSFSHCFSPFEKAATGVHGTARSLPSHGLARRRVGCPVETPRQVPGIRSLSLTPSRSRAFPLQNLGRGDEGRNSTNRKT